MWFQKVQNFKTRIIQPKVEKFDFELKLLVIIK